MQVSPCFSEKPKIAVVGLGYVGLPLAVALSKAFEDVIGFDSNPARIRDLQHGIDKTGAVGQKSFLRQTSVSPAMPKIFQGQNLFIVAVPTPLDAAHRPDLGALSKASETIGGIMQPGSVVCYESTVYPGVTEDICRIHPRKDIGTQTRHRFLSWLLS
ncbi:NAD(P)-binding domain-containing protein [Acetomicrobium sp.]|uniref:NAD(P)-binding domain-containing protein n=1 Tax=Acetomicrobium sp. TaxID=1872099 RepID=UPI002FC917A4